MDSLLTNKTTDEGIAREVQKGDIESFSVLVERYQGKLLRYGRKFLFNSYDDIEDVVQDIFIKAYKNILSFNPKMKFSSWIYRIAHNEFINMIQKIKRTPLLTFDFDEFIPHLLAKETADEGMNEKDIKTILNKGLDEIDGKYREPLILYYFEEMSYQEISEILRLPISTVGVRIKRAKELLKKSLHKVA